MRVVAAMLMLVAVLAACSKDSAQPVGPDVAPEPTRQAPNGPISPVRNPKNLAAIQPCLMLTAAQLEAIRIDQPGVPKAVLGSAGCEWGDSAKTRQFAAFVDIGNDVLRNVYSQRNALPVFEITEVAGLPAIRTKDNVDGSTCYFRVATAETQTLIVRFTLLRQDRGDSCGPARAFAETVVGNLPPLAG
ncbi:MAG: DUF3558 domain-containing protein [Pseudonocardiaceae bacterium]